MSRYSIKSVILLALVSTHFSYADATADMFEGMEDAMIMEAILSEDVGDINRSKETYEGLYEITGNKEYLIQESKLSLMEKSGLSHSVNNLLKWTKAHPKDKDRALYRLLSALYVEQDLLKDAENIADKYLLTDDAPIDDQVAVAALKSELGKPIEALAILDKVYSQSWDETALMMQVDIKERQMLDIDSAIEIINTHIAKYDKTDDVSVGVYFKLIELYSKKKQLDKVIDVYKKLYHQDPQAYFLDKIIETSLYINDLDGVVAFLEKDGGHENRLFKFYKKQKEYQKAINLARKFYKKKSDPKWLAEEAILIYEKTKAKLKSQMPETLKKMQSLFGQALEDGLADSTYLNYYGYILIDHDLDLDGGIDLVRRSLLKEPKNIYYLDSLAWGFYKKGKCKEAAEIMKKISDSKRVEEEIWNHWSLIERCISNRNGK